MAGRKSRLSQEPELTKKFVDFFVAGVPVYEACLRLDVPLSCYKDWLRWGSIERKGGAPAKEPFATFAKEVRKALADFEGSLVDEIRRQAKDARWASDGDEQLDDRLKIVVPAHKKGDIILNPKGYVARPGDWEAARYLLEQRFPKRWRRRVDSVAVNVNTAPAAPPRIVVVLEESEKKCPPAPGPQPPTSGLSSTPPKPAPGGS